MSVTAKQVVDYEENSGNSSPVTGIPLTGFLRLPQIIGDPKNNIPALVPVSKTAWYDGIRAGRYPAPVKLSPRCSAWRVEDIRRLIDEVSGL